MKAQMPRFFLRAIWASWLLLFLVQCTGVYNSYAPRPEPTRQFQNGTLALTEVWRWSVALNPSIEQVVSAGGTVVFDSAEYGLDLQAINLRTGQPVWQIADEKMHAWAMTADDRKLYIVMGTDSGTEIVTYRASDGQRFWDTRLKNAPGHAAYRLRMKNTLLQVYTYPPDATWLYQLDTAGIGEVSSVSQAQRSPLSELWLQVDGRSYWRSNDTVTGRVSLIASDSYTNQLYWEWRMPVDSNYVHELPVVVEQQMFLNFGDSVVNLDLNTGQPIWHTSVAQGIVSNFAQGERNGCFLRRDAALVCLDLQSGVITGELYFQPTTDPNRARYRVLMAENMILVYFGDTHELIALEP